MPYPTQGTVVRAHKTQHQDVGTDEISVVGLSGLLADDQHILDAEAVALLPNAIASTLLVNSNDTERSTAATSYTKLKETKLGQSTLNTVTVKFDLKTANADYPAFGRIYRNGVAIGTERSTVSTAYVTFSEDFDASGWVKNDLIQVYVYIVSGSTAYVANLRFYYTLGYLVTNQDPA